MATPFIGSRAMTPNSTNPVTNNSVLAGGLNRATGGRSTATMGSMKTFHNRLNIDTNLSAPGRPFVGTNGTLKEHINRLKIGGPPTRTDSRGATASAETVTMGIYVAPGEGVNADKMAKQQLMFSFKSDPLDPFNRTGGSIPFVNQVFKTAQDRFRSATEIMANNPLTRNIDPNSQLAKRKSAASEYEKLESTGLFVHNLDRVPACLAYHGAAMSIGRMHQGGDITALSTQYYQYMVAGLLDYSVNMYGEVGRADPLEVIVTRPNTGFENADLSYDTLPPLQMLPHVPRNGAVYFSSPFPLRSLIKSRRESNERRLRVCGTHGQHGFLKEGNSNPYVGLTGYLVGNRNPRMIQGAVTEPHYGEKPIRSCDIGKFDLAFRDIRLYPVRMVTAPARPRKLNPYSKNTQYLWKDANVDQWYTIDVAKRFFIGVVQSAPQTRTGDSFPEWNDVKRVITQQSMEASLGLPQRVSIQTYKL